MNGPEFSPLQDRLALDILDASPDGVLVVGGMGRIAFANAGIEALFGYKPVELIGQPLEMLLRQADRDRHAGLREQHAAHFRNHTMARQLPIVGLRKDGTLLEIEVRLGSAMTHAGRVTVAFLSDIGESRRKDAELLRLNRALSLIHDCNEALVRAESEGELLDAICQRLTQAGAFAGAWVAYADDFEAAAVRLAMSAAPGGAIDGDSRIIERAGDAIRRAATVLTGAQGEAATIALPFAPREDIPGCLIVEVRGNEALPDDEMRLMRELADDLAYGIRALRTRELEIRQATQLQRRNHYDDLTGLPNRLRLATRIDETLRTARSSTGILLVGLDRFSAVNDSFGHDAGDQLLVEVSARINAAVRRGDSVGRLSGDEFAVLLSDLSSPSDASAVADKIREALTMPLEANGQTVLITATIGAAIAPQDGTCATALVAHAESAMMRAKANGRNSFSFYREALDAGHLERLSLERDMSGALERGEFILHFQPVVSLTGHCIESAEALLRWQHPERGLIPPVEFIPLAEDNGLIVPIGRWVIESACRQCAEWRASGHPSITVAVNLSARQFHDDCLETDIANALQAAGLPPEALILEITESLLMGDVEASGALIRRLRERGLRFALDDFGTGYSSLAYLKSLPIASLKVDRCFVRDIATDPNDAAIVDAIIAMAHALHLHVVAEGVENDAQLAYLRGRACDAIQGYRFSRPVDRQTFAALLNGGIDLIADSRAPGLLIVDDEPSIVAALRRILRREHFPIFSAGSAVEGLAILEKQSIAVIVTDQRMPGMSGSEFLAEARSINPRAVRMMLSGYADIDAITAIVNECGIFSYLSKPWDSEELRDTIRRAFIAYAAR